MRWPVHRSSPFVIAFLGAITIGTAPLAAQARVRVPDLPPDSFPADLYHDSVMTADAAGARWSRAVIAVHFTPEASQSERQRVVDAVDGVVIGGVVLIKDGYYLIRVPHGATLEGVDRALAAVGKAIEWLPEGILAAPWWRVL